MEENGSLSCIKCKAHHNLTKFSILKNGEYCLLCLDCKGRIVSLMYKARNIKNKGVTKMSNSLSKHFLLQLTEKERQKVWDFWIDYYGKKITIGMIKRIIGIKD